MQFEFKSIWSHTCPVTTDFPSVDKSLSADVIIVGGGISGVVCAHLLGRAGIDVVLVEANKIGHGTTGLSTGNLYATVDQHLHKLKSTWGQKTAEQVVHSRLSTIDFIQSIVSDLKIDCSFRRVSLFHFSENGGSEAKEFIQKEGDAARSLGLITHPVKSTPLPFGDLQGLEISNQAQFHPLRFVTELSLKLPKNVRVFENSPVIDFDLDNHTVTCPQGVIKGKRIVLATHIPKGFASIQLRLSPIREHGMAAPLTKGYDFPGTFWRIESPKRSIRTISDGNQLYVIVIGDKFKTGHNSDPDQENEILDSFISKHFSVTDQRYWWAAQSYRSADQIPFIGELQNGVYFSTGFSADGLIYGTLGAQIISDTILGRKNKWADLYSPHRSSLIKSLPKMAHEGLDTFCQYAQDLPKLGTVSPEDIKAGEGGIVERSGDKIAAYRDEKNQLHLVSAVCTHMKCIVRFNPAEKTWDCPCHASRFRTDGSVIEGPAVHPLEKKTL